MFGRIHYQGKGDLMNACNHGNEIDKEVHSKRKHHIRSISYLERISTKKNDNEC
jgi:hypothetical protein